MNTIQFKTNIKCTGCLSKVSPILNKVAGENNWQVDLEAPTKTLTLSQESLEKEVLNAVKEAGFIAERL